MKQKCALCNRLISRVRHGMGTFRKHVTSTSPGSKICDGSYLYPTQVKELTKKRQEGTT